MRVNIEYFCCICACDGHESAGIQEPVMHTPFPDEGHAIFDSINAIRNLREVAQAQFLLVFIEGAVVAACHLKIIAGKIKDKKGC